MYKLRIRGDQSVVCHILHLLSLRCDRSNDTQRDMECDRMDSIRYNMGYDKRNDMGHDRRVDMGMTEEMTRGIA